MESALAADAGGAERYASQPAHQAQDLIYDAWEATGARRVTLARQALALWPDCADAYVLLAQETASLGEARGLLERGVAAGERALGPRTFAQAGHFWLIFETRPYMRARAALAETLWRLGRREEAVEHQRELLRLNPPAYAVFGEETEAIDYAAGAGELWGNVPGALAWLES